MIPLLRPLIPSIDEWKDEFFESQKAGLYSNFGPCYQKAKTLLLQDTGKHCVPVSSGMTAIEAALLLSLPEGARVAVPDFTFPATILAIIKCKMKPVIFPTDTETLCISMKSLKENSKMFDGFIAVSPFGYWCDSEAYSKLADQLNKKAIFDFAGSYGMETKTNYPIAYSFHATKNLGIGEGGCIALSSNYQAKLIEELINFSFSDERVVMNEVGFNGKLDELHCAMIIAHIQKRERLAGRIQKKRKLIDSYLSDFKDIVLPMEGHSLGAPYSAVLGGFDNAEDLIALAKANGIILRHAYYPMLSSLSCFLKYPRIEEPDPIFETFIALPSDVSENEYSKVAEFVLKYGRRYEG